MNLGTGQQILKMSRSVLRLLVYSVLFGACSHRVIPATSKTYPGRVYLDPERPLVIIDGKGNLLVNKKELPAGASSSILQLGNARAFSPEQIKRLAYRFKTIPPKVLYVPPALTEKSPRGIYYVYQSRFWFWKQQDGYFYLDPNYYR